MELKSERLRGESYDWFRDNIEELAKSTQEQYTKKFLEFLEWADYDTESLLAQHTANLKDEDKRKRAKIPNLVYKFQVYRVEEFRNKATGRGDKVASSRMIVKATKKFFKANFTAFEMYKKLKVRNGEQAITSLPVITRSQLKEVLQVCGSIRMMSVIHTAKETGFRISDVCLIQMRHIQPILDDPDVEYHTWEQLPKKNMGQDQPLNANPVIGKEAIDYIRRWVKLRKEMGITSENLYTSVKNVKAHTNTLGIDNKESKRGEPLNPSNAGVLFRNFRNKAGLRETGISIHGLRKYHTTQLMASDVKEATINKLQGRRGTGTFGVYYRPDSEKLIEEYAKGYSKLAILTETTANQIEEAQRLNKALLERIATLEQIDEQRALEMQQDVKTQLDNFKQEIEAYKIILGKQAKAENKRIEEQVTQWIKDNPDKIKLHEDQ